MLLSGKLGYEVTTANIPAAEYDPTVANRPTGVTIQGKVTIAANGKGTLTLAGDETTTAAVTSTLTLQLDGATSAQFAIEIEAPAPVPTIAVTAVGLDDLKVGVYVSEVNAYILYTLTNGVWGLTPTGDFDVSGLPGGLTLGTKAPISDTQFKVGINGTPTAAGVFPITAPETLPAYTVKDATSEIEVTVPDEIKVTVAEGDPPPTIEVSAAGFDDLKVGVFISGASIVFTITNGTFSTTSPEHFPIGNLPSGLNVTFGGSTTQKILGIYGTPETAGVFEIDLPSSLAAEYVIGATSDVPITISGGSITLTVAEADPVGKLDGAAVSGAPTVNGTPTESSITVNAVTIPTNPGSQEVEYAISTTQQTPENPDDWQPETTFDGLKAATIYYVFARSKANDDYNAGTAKCSTAIATDGSTGVSITMITSKSGNVKFVLEGSNISVNWGDGIIDEDLSSGECGHFYSSVGPHTIIITGDIINYFDCFDIGLTVFNISDCPTLKGFSVWDNELATLDVSANTELEWFECGENNITALDASANIKLNYLGCQDNNMNAAALNALFLSLPTYSPNSETGKIVIGGNGGFATCNKASLAAKGWAWVEYEEEDD